MLIVKYGNDKRLRLGTALLSNKDIFDRGEVKALYENGVKIDKIIPVYHNKYYLLNYANNVQLDHIDDILPIYFTTEKNKGEIEIKELIKIYEDIYPKRRAQHE